MRETALVVEFRWKSRVLLCIQQMSVLSFILPPLSPHDACEVKNSTKTTVLYLISWWGEKQKRCACVCVKRRTAVSSFTREENTGWIKDAVSATDWHTSCSCPWTAVVWCAHLPVNRSEQPAAADSSSGLGDSLRPQLITSGSISTAPKLHWRLSFLLPSAVSSQQEAFAPLGTIWDKPKPCVFIFFWGCSVLQELFWRTEGCSSCKNSYFAAQFCKPQFMLM